MRTSRMLLGAAVLIGAATAPCASQDDVLPITSARVSQLLTGLAAERPIWAKVRAMEDSAEAAAESDAKAAMNADQAATQRREKYQEWEACSERVAAPMPRDVQQHAMKVNQKLMTLPEGQQSAIAKMGEAMEQAAGDAAKRGDLKTMETMRKAWRDQIAQITGIPVAELAAGDAKMQAWSDANDTKVEKSCGREPTAPADPEAELARRMRQQMNEGNTDAIDRMSEQAGITGARASGLPARQYAVLRERVSAFIASTDGSSFGAYTYTDTELAVLRQRAGEIRRFGELLNRTPTWNFE